MEVDLLLVKKVLILQVARAKAIEDTIKHMDPKLYELFLQRFEAYNAEETERIESIDLQVNSLCKAAGL